MKTLSLLLCAAVLAAAFPARAAVVVDTYLSPMTTFGGGDGWLAPGERPYLTTDSTQRGLAFNPATGHLLMVNRAGALSVQVLDAASGADVGTLNVAGIFAGGIFPLNMIAAADDGVIYAANLADTATAQFRIYRWENESAAPLWEGRTTTSVGRLGDTLDVRGVSYQTDLLVGISGGTASDRGYNIFHTSGGAPYTRAQINFATDPPQPGDHRLGITFTTGDAVIGTQGGLVNFVDFRPARVSTFSNGVGALVVSPVLASSAERPMDFALIGGIPVLATVNTETSLVRLYDITDPSAPVLLDAATNITGLSIANPNGVGQVRFGNVLGNTATLYALNTNNGIQAFNVQVPEPAGLTLLTVAALALTRRMRK